VRDDAEVPETAQDAAAAAGRAERGGVGAEVQGFDVAGGEESVGCNRAEDVHVAGVETVTDGLEIASAAPGGGAGTRR
jgi:hypothetical protein